jgi:hypothetical protein
MLLKQDEIDQLAENARCDMSGMDGRKGEAMWCDRPQFNAFAKAIQLALIEKLRKFPESHEYQDREGNWKPFINRDHYVNTLKDGSWPIRDLFTLPTLDEQDE